MLCTHTASALPVTFLTYANFCHIHVHTSDGHVSKLCFPQPRIYPSISTVGKAMYVSTEHEKLCSVRLRSYVHISRVTSELRVFIK